MSLVQPYDPSWPSRFDSLHDFYRKTLGDLLLASEHVGSTAVTGMTAKPIIDIDLVISPDTFETVKQRLERKGFEHEGDLGVPKRDAFKPIDPALLAGLPKHHPYICPSDSQELERHLTFRNFLRKSPEYVDRLSRLKQELCTQHGDDREAYILGKAPFCAEIRRLALQSISKTYCPPSLGLKRGGVTLVPHDPEWVREFEHQEKLLRYHVGHLVDDIQHVGSTSIPGLRAKPILDIAIAIPDRDRFDPLRDSMEEIGYIYRGDKGKEGGWLLVMEGEPDVRYVHAHVVETSDPQWQYDYIGYRDRLRSDPQTRSEYARLKTTNETTFKNDRRAYTAAKVDFVYGILEELRSAE